MSYLSAIDPYADSYPPSLWEETDDETVEEPESTPVKRGAKRVQRQ